MYQAGALCGIIFMAVVTVCAVVSLYSAFLLLGARMCEIESRSFAGAVYSTLVGGLGSAISSILVILTDAGRVAGFILGLHMMAFAMKFFFKTTFGKAYGAALLGWLGYTVAVLVIAMIVLIIADPTGALTAQIFSGGE